MKKNIEVGIYALVFLLPWQTRWIFDAGNFSGQRSEYLTRSLYGTDIFLIILLILASIFIFQKAHFSSDKKFTSIYPFMEVLRRKVKVMVNFSEAKPLIGGLASEKFAWLVFFFLCLLSFLVADNKTLALVGEAKIFLAVGLFWLVRKFAKPGKVALAFVLSLLAPASLALWQFLTQATFANKWLGLAEHPAYLGGSSVLETFANGMVEGRWLRAYGSFDHPNILGSVLVVGILVVIILLFLEAKPPIGGLASKNISSKKYFWLRLFFHFALILFSAALFASFSRGAWLALLLGEIVLGAGLFFQKEFATLKIWFFSTLIILASFLVMLAGYHDLVVVRVQSNVRLEKLSLDQRATYVQQAKTLLKQNFVAGVGVGNYVTALMKATPNEPAWIYQPVHNVFLLIWVELGLGGLLLSILLFGKLFWIFVRRKKIASIVLSLALLPALLLDHWLWSFHYGILFFALVIAMVIGFSEEKKV
ncbi:MAG: O-antigen ligase family protein [Candidatus Moraniibacteriota bacterium]